MIPTPLTVILVAAQIGLVALILAAIAVAARAERRAGGQPGIGYFIAADATVAWAALIFVLAKNAFFASTSTTKVPVLGFAIVLPILVGVALLRRPSFREALGRIPVHWLVGVQSYRALGALFVIAYLEHHMPAQFALPAGIGDILVGLGAPFAAYRVATASPDRARSAGATWCVLGIADLVIAVTCGFLSAPSVFQALALNDPNTAITRFPFVLIPTFAVPLSIVLHVFVLSRLRRPAPTLAAAPAGARRA